MSYALGKPFTSWDRYCPRLGQISEHISHQMEAFVFVIIQQENIIIISYLTLSLTLCWLTMGNQMVTTEIFYTRFLKILIANNFPSLKCHEVAPAQAALICFNIFFFMYVADVIWIYQDETYNRRTHKIFLHQDQIRITMSCVLKLNTLILMQYGGHCLPVQWKSWWRSEPGVKHNTTWANLSFHNMTWQGVLLFPLDGQQYLGCPVHLTWVRSILDQIRVLVHLQVKLHINGYRDGLWELHVSVKIGHRCYTVTLASTQILAIMWKVSW